MYATGHACSTASHSSRITWKHNACWRFCHAKFLLCVWTCTVAILLQTLKCYFGSSAIQFVSPLLDWMGRIWSPSTLPVQLERIKILSVVWRSQCQKQVFRGTLRPHSKGSYCFLWTTGYCATGGQDKIFTTYSLCLHVMELFDSISQATNSEKWVSPC